MSKINDFFYFVDYSDFVQDQRTSESHSVMSNHSEPLDSFSNPSPVKVITPAARESTPTPVNQTDNNQPPTQENKTTQTGGLRVSRDSNRQSVSLSSGKLSYTTEQASEQ